MKYSTVLSCVVALAGSVARVQAQTFTIEARLVVDGEAGTPTGAGITTYLPGPSATRVGLTLQARMRQNTPTTVAGAGNYGIGGLANPAFNSSSRFTHSDAYSVVPYNPFGRGQVGTSIGADGLPIAGVFGIEGGRDFRFPMQPPHVAADWNTLNTNAPTSDTRLSAKSNGYFPAGAGRVEHIVATVPILGTHLGTSPLFAIGELSGWYNLYRAYFDPRLAFSREVTVSVYGRFQGISRFLNTDGFDIYTIGNAGGTTGAILDTTISATFQVPVPGAAALIPLAALTVSRHRRTR